MTVTALYPVLMTDRPAASARFYADLLDLEAVFEADWFVQLTGQMGFVARDHDSVPERFRGATPTGLLVTVEVDDVDAVHERAVALGLPMELTLRSEDWGQRHFITRDPDGVAVDVVQVIPVTSEAIAAHYVSPPSDEPRSSTLQQGVHVSRSSGQRGLAVGSAPRRSLWRRRTGDELGARGSLGTFARRPSRSSRGTGVSVERHRNGLCPAAGLGAQRAHRGPVPALAPPACRSRGSRGPAPRRRHSRREGRRRR